MFFRRKTGAVSWLVVFLGNPGSRYDNTRHNAGFMAADETAKKTGVRINRLKYNSLTAPAQLGGQGVLLMKPQTFMNLSGDAVRQAMGFYKIPLDKVLVVCDDVTLPAGKLRIRRQGSAGGHNGLRDIIAKCGGDGFPRIKIGVGSPPHKDYDMADWVLARLEGEDKTLISDAAKHAADAVETVITSGLDHAMGIFN